MGAWLFAASLVAPAQTGPRLTAWRAADGLPQSATVGVALGLRGDVLTVHSAGLPVARLDGFGITTISNSVGASARVWESRSGQLWSVGSEGLLEQTGGGWTLHPLPEVLAEYRANPVRTVRPLPLLPAERNHVVVLLPDRLIEYDAGERRTTLILLAADTPLGRFAELSPARGDGAWVSGSKGLLRIPGPLRQLRPESAIEAYEVPGDLEVAELQRPFEDRWGGVVMAAEGTASRERVVVRFADGRWEKWTVPGQNVRQAWSGADGELWAHTAGTVLRLEPGDGDLRAQPVLQVGRVADLAVEPGGVAWVATSEGLFRIAPLPWRSAPGFPADAGAVLAVTSDRRGRVIAASSTAVHWLEGTAWRSLALAPGTADEIGRAGEVLFPLPDGGLLVRRGATNEYIGPDGVPAAPDATLAAAVPLGTLSDGRVLLYQRDGEARRLLAHDGGSATDYAVLPAEAEALGPPTMVLQTRAGELWVGGTRGLLVRRGAAWTLVTDPESTPEDGALAGLELPDGRVLIGGADSVREFEGRGWRVLRRGLDRVHGLSLGRDRSVWVASGSGLHRWMDNSWLAVGEEEGLPATTVYAVFEDGAGRLWAGTARGLAGFDPGADVDGPAAVIAGADVPEEAGDNRALFVVGGEDRWRFTTAGRLLFSWRLDNNPWSAWRPASSVQFTNLTVGTHRFQVRAMDPSLNVQRRPGTLEFAVTLPWFKDPRLKATSVALALVLVAMAVQAALGYRRLKLGYAEVERQVAERSAALERANAELLHSQKMRALGTLAAGVAHDFNSLLSIIRGSAQLLEGDLDDPVRVRQRLGRIRTAVDQGAGLVKAMLGYSRGAAAPHRALDATEVVENAVRLLEERLHERLSYHPPVHRPPAVTGSPELLQQIIVNLVQNADEAMEHRGTVRIEVGEMAQPPAECALRPAPGAAYVVIAVRDQGAGIPPEHRSRIFEPFFTTKGFSSRRGTGLGLSMVYEFAKDLGAGIVVDSELGAGSSFSILLPARRAGVSVSAAPGPRAATVRSAESASRPGGVSGGTTGSPPPRRDD